MKYISRKILRGKNIYIDSILEPKDYDPNNIDSILLRPDQLFPENLDFRKVKPETLKDIPVEKMIMITPEQAKTLSNAQIEAMGIERLMNMSREAIDALGSRVNTAIAAWANLPDNKQNLGQFYGQVAGIPNVFNHLNKPQMEQMNQHNPEAVLESAPADKIDNIKINHDEYRDDDDSTPTGLPDRDAGHARGRVTGQI